MPKKAEGSAAPGLILVEDLSERLPESVFVLVLPADDTHGGVEVWRAPRTGAVVVAYSSVQILIAECGSGQPWVQVSRDQLEAICDDGSVDSVALDLSLPGGPRYPEIDSREQPELPLLDDVDTDRSFVYIPSRPYRTGQQEAVLELQPHQGRRTLLAFTSPEEVQHGCGPNQAWVAIPSDLVDEAAWRSGAEAVLFNPSLSEDARHAAPVVDWTQRR